MFLHFILILLAISVSNDSDTGSSTVFLGCIQEDFFEGVGWGIIFVTPGKIT